MAAVCDTPLWDTNLTWDTPDPDFTPCFQKSILALVPCFFLWLVIPFRILQLWHAHVGIIPWNWLSVLKMAVAGVLFAFAAYEFCFVIAEAADGESKPPIEFLSPFAVLVTMILVMILLNLERKRGIRSSSVLTLFWLLFLFCGIIRLRSVIKEAMRTGDVSPSLFVHYPCLLFATLLSVFVDQKPEFGYQDEGENPCPEKDASFLSRITFWWFTSLVVQGYKRSLTQADLWSLNKEDTAEYVAQKFYKNWNLNKEVPVHAVANGGANETSFIFKEGSAILATYNPGAEEAKSPKRNLFPALVRTYFWFFLQAGLFKLFQDILTFVNPQLLKLLIQFTSSSEYTWRGYFYTTLLLVVALVQSILLHQYFHCTFLLGMRIRSTIIAVVYRKTLRLSNSAKKTSTVGEIVNLMSVDAQRFMDLTTYIHTIWSGPLQICLALYFLWQTLGPSALAGIAVMVLLIPINAVIAHKSRKYQTIQMKLKDSRIKLMNEILNGIKVLKLYAWEGSFQEKVLDIRNQELVVLRKMAILNALAVFFWTCAPVLVSLTTFGVFVLSSPDNVLDAEKAFVSLALFNILRFPLSMVPNVITSVVQTNVSLQRIQKFLDNPELDPDCVERQEYGKYGVRVENGTFEWEEGHPTLSNINLDIEEGELVAVVGAVGSGKSSLLSAILGEMTKVTGTVSVKGSVSYVAQQAWIQNDTLQNNILFSKPLEHSFYSKVIEACALQPDLDILGAGDKTEIGEKGINLSGGQKQRVSLARAVYQDADVYLLDDPLSAVDSHVGKHLFDKVIGPEGMLKGKTRVLVTHGIGFLPQVDKIIVLVNGEISESGSFSELLKYNGAFAEFLRNYLTELNSEDPALQDLEVLSIRDEIISQLEATIDHKDILERRVSVINERIRKQSLKASNPSLNNSSPTPKRRYTKSDIMDQEEKKPLKKDDSKLVQAETMETGTVKLNVYMTYVRAIGIMLSLVIILFSILFNATGIYSNIWLSQWSNDARNPNITADASNRNMRLGVYGALGIIQGIIIFVASLMRLLGAIKASRVLHIGILSNVIRSPMSFFDTTPSGRIVNRFSKDLDTLDIMVPMLIGMFLNCMFQTASTLLVISFSTPLFLAVVVPLLIFYYFVQ
ncbi:unnamed protein product, partial [Candidula unifasciata]